MISARWKIFLFIALITGAFLRLTFVEDMEWKEDEEYNYTQAQTIGRTQPWPWIGMPSGVYVANPGMSVWVFAALARVFGAETPTSLANSVQVFSLLGICLILPFAFLLVKKDDEREIWLWAFALAMVNPFAVLYQRKLWPEPFLPFFTMLMLMGWWNRRKSVSAATWGFFGACLGQIHMSGFFLAGSFAVWTALFDRKSVHWKGWLLGSSLGALPLIPWANYVLTHPVNHSVTTAWEEVLQLKFWVFWVSDPLGLHLGNPLGLLRGQSNWAQISDFVRYPIIQRKETYLVGVAHLVIVGIAAWTLVRGLVKHVKSDGFGKGQGEQTVFAQNAGIWGFGILMTLSLVNIRRYYMMVSFPLEFIWWIRMLFTDRKRARIFLGALWIAQGFISANFVHYIHTNGGSTQGDYGVAYRLVKKK